MKTTAELRQAFIQFFESKGHEPVASSSLVPHEDPTLLFTNAGMVPFKDVFLGRDKREYVRATSSQRCVRAGGKHNDLENVGYTARHHTFFEMLGNFSFGDYFKQDAIRYAWEFLTEVMELPEERLWVTVYEEDDETADIWLTEMQVSPDRFVKIGAKDNFWSMGDTGPCGPCTEIFYDHGEDVAGGPPGSPDEDGDRYIEIWNLVFMQYNRSADGTMTPLPKPSVDTGMGLERLAAVMQSVHSNYEIDLFQHLIKAAAEATNTTDLDNKSLRVIADHIRSASFLVVDGVMPANEGRGYVLRRIIRRAIRHGYQLGQTGTFFYTLVDALVAEMGNAYKELNNQKDKVQEALKREEIRFAETLEQGMKILDQAIADMSGTEIPGNVAFKLYDTYGFPVDLTADIAREKGLTLDEKGFELSMQEQRDRARAASQFAVDQSVAIDIEGETDFTGYDNQQDNATVIAMFRDGEAIEQMTSGQQGMVILDRTPFYAESGGQVGDTGQLQTDDTNFDVHDTQKQNGNVFTHIGKVSKGELNIGDTVTAIVDQEKRQAIALNHSATHLLHAALHELLGEHVAQKGSLVDAERLRFDFSHPEPVTVEEIQNIERLVNAKIRENSIAQTRIMSLEDAKSSGAKALFGEKYDKQVRVIRLGSFSVELCGGIHVRSSGDIGLMKIISETGTASGIRRIEAVTGETALQWVIDEEQKLFAAANLLKANRDDVTPKIEQLLDRNKKLEKELQQLKSKLASAAGGDIVSKAIEINGIKVLAEPLEGADAKSLREFVDQLKDKLGSAIIVVAAVNEEKIALAAGVTKDLIKDYKAGDLVRYVAEQIGGKGGGRPDFAQAGGSDVAALPAALASVKDWVSQ